MYLYIVVKTCYITVVANIYKSTKERYIKDVLQIIWFFMILKLSLGFRWLQRQLTAWSRLHTKIRSIVLVFLFKILKTVQVLVRFNNYLYVSFYRFQKIYIVFTFVTNSFSEEKYTTYILKIFRSWREAPDNTLWWVLIKKYYFAIFFHFIWLLHSTTLQQKLLLK